MGEPTVTDVKAYNACTQKSVLQYASVAEKGSEHPLAEAILAKAETES